MNTSSFSFDDHDPYALVDLSSAPVSSQSPQRASRASIPFDFVVGEMLLPAGDYEVERTDLPTMLALRKVGCSCPAALVQAIGVGDASPKLMFYRHENLFFLAQVLAGNS